MIFPFIDQHKGEWPVSVLCQALGVSTQGYYAWCQRPASDREQRRDGLLVEIEALHEQVCPFTQVVSVCADDHPVLAAFLRGDHDAICSSGQPGDGAW